MKTKDPASVAIIGFGRFGQLLASLLKADFNVAVVEENPAIRKLADQKGFEIIPLSSVMKVDIVFLAVPISAFEEVVKSVVSFIAATQTVIDVCSVKVYPALISCGDTCLTPNF